MIILLECPLSINRYIKEIHTYESEVKCPYCDRRLRKHGSYQRSIVFKRRIYTIPVLRRRCPSCDVTFSLLPCFTSPGMTFANHIREYMGRWLLAGACLSELPERLSTAEVSIVSLRTLQRWRAKLFKRGEDWFLKQRLLLANEYEDGDGILALYREGLHSRQEIELLLTFFLGSTSLPRKGSIISKMNLRLPPAIRW
jgi:transposase-like protein